MANPDGAPPVLDLAPIQRLTGGDGELTREFLGIFEEDMFAQLDRLEEAASSGDLRQIESVAHRIKGSAGDVGGIQVQRLAAEIEQGARQGLLDQCRSLVPDLRDRLMLLKGALDTRFPR
jgi:HPt (histidine-containing phosphotransfer) domain-containing protein